MDFMTAFDIGASALSAERTHMNIIAMNLANAKTTRTVDGGPYQRRSVTFESVQVQSPFSKAMDDALNRELKGVRVMDVARDQRAFKNVYEPGHPDANKDGYVKYPDINVVEEMANMMNVSRSYEANTATIQSVKSMFEKALMLGR